MHCKRRTKSKPFVTPYIKIIVGNVSVMRIRRWIRALAVYNLLPIITIIICILGCFTPSPTLVQGKPYNFLLVIGTLGNFTFLVEGGELSPGISI